MESKKRKASLIETQNKKGTNGKNKIIKTTKNKNDIFELLKKKIENGETIDVLFEDLVEIEDIRQEEKSFKLRDMKLIHLMKRMETNKFISGGKILREGYFIVGGSFIKSKERASRITEKSKYFKRSYVIKFDQNGKDKIFAVYGVGIITKTGNIQQIDKQRNLCGAEMSLDQFTSEIYKHFMTEEMKEPETKARRCGWKANYLLKSMEDLERWESISDKNTKYQCPFKNWVPLDKCRILGYQLCMSLSNNKINEKENTKGSIDCLKNKGFENNQYTTDYDTFETEITENIKSNGIKFILTHKNKLHKFGPNEIQKMEKIKNEFMSKAFTTC